MRCEYNCYVREHGAAARKGRKMNPSVFRIKLDLHGRMPGAVLRISEGDTARRLVCELCEDGRAYVFSDETYVIFEAIKPDGSTVAGDAAVIGASRIEYGIPSAAVSTRGTVSCCFKLYGADGLILTTPTFNIIVTEEVYDTDYPEGTDSFKALDGLITHTLNVIEKASTSASAADASASAAEASAAAAQDSASEAAASAATAASNAAGATAAAQEYADAAECLQYGGDGGKKICYGSGADNIRRNPRAVLRGGYSICLLGPRYHAYGVFALGLLDRVCYRQYRQCYASVRLPLCNRRADI